MREENPHEKETWAPEEDVQEEQGVLRMSAKVGSDVAGLRPRGQPVQPEMGTRTGISVAVGRGLSPDSFMTMSGGKTGLSFKVDGQMSS